MIENEDAHCSSLRIQEAALQPGWLRAEIAYTKLRVRGENALNAALAEVQHLSPEMMDGLAVTVSISAKDCLARHSR